MAQIIYRCEVCSSEILASAPASAPHVCLLCRLSAEEALSAVQAPASLRMPPMFGARKGGASLAVTPFSAPR
jgi:hypothetical protein